MIPYNSYRNQFHGANPRKIDELALLLTKLFKTSIDVYQHPPDYQPPHVPQRARTYLVKGAKNTPTRAFALHIYSAMCDCRSPNVKATNGTEYQILNPSEGAYPWMFTNHYYAGARVGSDQSTPTTWDMYALVNDLGNPNTTAITITEETDKVIVTQNSTWNAGRITETIGEIGLYTRENARNPADGKNYTVDFMIFRSSVADGDFSAFTPDPTLSLTVAYKIIIQKA